jgi:UDP-N-acetylmuramoyl-tripeptide--D-alanyl-D-alanine ligase
MNAPVSLWRSDDAAAATGGSNSADWTATGVSIDTRTLAAGDLFVALRGPNHDAHAFVGTAFAGGAAAAMVAYDATVESAGPLLRVVDTTEALTALAEAARARTAARLVAVTGSVGKTGTKEALRLVLSAQGATYATQGNLNNHWGVPLSLARLPAQSRFGVFELGMSAPGELTLLSKLVRPQVAIITTVAAAHVEFFTSVAEIARAKAEIFAGLEGGTAVIPRDNKHYELLRAAAEASGAGRIVSFGGHHQADVRLLSSMMTAESSVVNAELAGRRINYEIGAPGHHWVINSLAVLAAVAAVGADVDAAAEALAEVHPPRGRGARSRIALDGGSIELIDESYNASPAAMRAAFQTLMLANPEEGGRRIAVLGDMRELGDDGPSLHAALAQDAVEANIDLVFAAGPLMKSLYDALPPALRGAHAETSEALMPLVLDAVRPGDVVCVKGSLGSRMAPIVDALAGLERDAPANGAAARKAEGR